MSCVRVLHVHAVHRMNAAKMTGAFVGRTPTQCVLRVMAVTAAGATLAEVRERAYALAATMYLPADSCAPISRSGPSRTQDSAVVTFVELAPEAAGPTTSNCAAGGSAPLRG